MDIHKALELFRRVACLGIGDIEKMLDGDYNSDHILKTYESMREKHGEYGNFKFLFYLDEEYASMFFAYIGLRDLTLEKKDSYLSSLKFITTKE